MYVFPSDESERKVSTTTIDAPHAHALKQVSHATERPWFIGCVSVCIREWPCRLRSPRANEKEKEANERPWVTRTSYGASVETFISLPYLPSKVQWSVHGDPWTRAMGLACVYTVLLVWLFMVEKTELRCWLIHSIMPRLFEKKLWTFSINSWFKTLCFEHTYYPG